MTRICRDCGCEFSRISGPNRCSPCRGKMLRPCRVCRTPCTGTICGYECRAAEAEERRQWLDRTLRAMGPKQRALFLHWYRLREQRRRAEVRAQQEAQQARALEIAAEMAAEVAA